jgi:Na+/H+ antiporter NhaC
MCASRYNPARRVQAADSRMHIRPTALLGPSVALVIAGLLLWPSVDAEALAAQGASRLLESELDASLEALGAPDADARLFLALDGRLAGTPDPTVAFDVRLDGAPTAQGGFLRGVQSSLNRWNANRVERGLPPIRSVDAAAPVTVSLAFAVAGGALGWSADLAGGGPPFRWSPRSADGTPPLWRLPGRGALVPPLLAIVVALLFRRVLLALFLGILSGAALLAYAGSPEAGVVPAVGRGLLDVFTVYLRTELVDTFRIEILGFVIALVAAVGVMSRSGGVQGLVELLLRFARSVRSTLMVTWGMGLLIFFDDYTNCLLVGSTMRPLTDRMRISREKLAYIVDSTAAPVAGLSLLSTWIAFEVSTYSAQLPGVGITESAYAVFLHTIPYRYYCLFTIVFVLSTILTRRDFGPMLAAERRARSTGQLVRPGGTPMVAAEATRIEPPAGLPLDWRKAAFPIATVLVVTIGRILYDGGALDLARETPRALLTLEGLTGILDAGSGAGPIFIGALCGLVLAIWLAGSGPLRAGGLAGTVAALALHAPVGAWLEGRVAADAVGYLAWCLPGLGATALVWSVLRGRPTARPHLPGRDILGASVSSVRALVFAVLILLQAWMIGAVCRDVATADYLVALTGGAVSPVTLPALLFVVSALVALATGSSWSTMSILLPNVVALAAAVGSAHPAGSTFLVVVCIGSVLEGSILGDHCSPISDTTVLSSVSSASDHVDHVRTQMPYALICGALAVFAGYIPTVGWEAWSPALGLAVGSGLILLILFVRGRRVPDHRSGVTA